MFGELFQFVNGYLNVHKGQHSKTKQFPFRKKIDHIKRVYTWAGRLAEDIKPSVNMDALLIAAIFHDVGYAGLEEGMSHAENSARIFREYAAEHGYGDENTDFISYLISMHSNKGLLNEKDTPLELTILMEADLLDETGAMSIVWDCMVEGSEYEQSFMKAYGHIKSYSGRILNKNPMVTERAKLFWKEKQLLTEEFIKQLAYDIGMD